MNLQKLFHMILIAGFVLVDFIFFHDLFKPGNHSSFGQILTGLLSIIVFYMSINYLINIDK